MKTALKTAIALLCAVAAIGVIYIGITTYLNKRGDDKALSHSYSEDSVSSTSFESSESENSSVSENPSVPETISKSDIPVNFEELIEINPHIYAWINIPGTAIDFPVLQNPQDNEYYLRRNFTGEYDINGSIYSENYNKTDFTDFMTVLYGHTMKTGAMFAPLLQFMDKAYFEEHRTMVVYTDNALREYKIFAAYVWDTRHLLLSFDFDDSSFRDMYIGYIKGITSMESCIDANTEVTGSDRILTLSCCAHNGTARFLVQGVLTSERFVAD